MLINHMKLPTRVPPRARFDSLVLVYFKAKDAADEAAKEADHLKQMLSEFVDGSGGEETDKGRKFVGSVFTAQRSNIMESPTINVAALKKLAPKAAAKIVKKQTYEVIDEEAFTRAVDTGLIGPKTAQKIIVPGGVKGTRFSVKSNKEEQASE